jgi:hypothetical protein
MSVWAMRHLATYGSLAAMPADILDAFQIRMAFAVSGGYVNNGPLVGPDRVMATQCLAVGLCYASRSVATQPNQPISAP